MNDQNQKTSMTEENLKTSSDLTTEDIKKMLGIPEWVSNDLVEKAAANAFDQMIDEKFRLNMADDVWMKVKGYPIPESYSVEDKLDIFERYYHRAVAQSQGE